MSVVPERVRLAPQHSRTDDLQLKEFLQIWQMRSIERLRKLLVAIGPSGAGGEEERWPRGWGGDGAAARCGS